MSTTTWHTLWHHGTSTDGIDPRTVDVRYTHPIVGTWYPTTQVWSWEGGDAIVSMVLDGSYVTIRTGDVIRVIKGSLHDALLEVGLDPNAYRIRPWPTEGSD